MITRQAARLLFTRPPAVAPVGTRPLSGALNVHRGDSGPPFAFDAAAEEKIKCVLARYPPQHRRAAVLPLLHIAQRSNGGWTSRAVMDAVAARLDLPPMRVYEVATFYSMFRRDAPPGRHLLQLCTTTPCQLRGATAVWNALVRELGLSAERASHPVICRTDGEERLCAPEANSGDGPIASAQPAMAPLSLDVYEQPRASRTDYEVPSRPAAPGCVPSDGAPLPLAAHTTPDRLFTLEQVECAGACANAPVLAIDGAYYEDVSPADAVRLVRSLRAGTEIPPPGPVGGRRCSCEPEGGQTTLIETVDLFSLFRADL